MAMTLLTEVERQKRALSELPSDYTFPLFNARHALESQRRSGYRNTAAAAREIIDNSVQAGASLVDVVFAQDYPKGKRVVTDIAFIDDGPGMLPEMSRFALSWGGGTRFDDTSGIGRFGFGLPNASINQTRQVEVYTRVDAEEPIYKAWLDLSEFGDYEQQSVPPPVEAELPDFVVTHLKRVGRRFDHGVVVCWRNPDHLTYKKAGPLKESLLDDFGSVYRYLLKSSSNADGVQVVVEGVAVEPVDPLFLMPAARLYLPEDKGGAQLVETRILPVGVEVDAETGDEHLRLLQDDGDVLNVVRSTTFQIKIARFPVGFVAIDHKAADPDAQRRGEVRKGRRGISFVRGGRELQTVDAFPRSRSDISSGLGRWPLLQSYAYHWGVEITFGSELDDALGITNDKQGVRPSEDFWRVLTEAGIDEALRRENAWQVEQRSRSVPPPSGGDGPTPAERSAAAADTAGGTPTRVPPRMLEIARANLDRAVETKAAATGASPDEVRAAIREEARRRRFRVDHVEEASAYAPFYTPMWVGDQLVIRINTASAFYRVLYGDLMRLRGGQRAKEAIDVLLIALGKAELTVDDDDLRIWYETQRVQRWSPYLDTAIRSLQQQLPLGENASTEQENDTGGVTAA